MTTASVEETPPVAAQAPDSNPKSSREYVVLQETTLALLLDTLYPEEFPNLPDDQIKELEAVTIYTHVAAVEARNTEHALTQAGIKAEGSHPTLVPIAARHFRAETITVDRSPRVRVG